MRMLLFFDLPMVSARERKIYATFRKQLTQEGFVMMQQSVYSKLVLNSTNEKSTYDRLRKIIPDNGVVPATDDNRAAIRLNGIFSRGVWGAIDSKYR